MNIFLWKIYFHSNFILDNILIQQLFSFPKELFALIRYKGYRDDLALYVFVLFSLYYYYFN